MANKNILPKVIDKATEIKVLWELFQADTYFTDFFSHDDIQQMENNIKHDIPLLNATSISEKYENCKEVNTQMAKDMDQINAGMKTRGITIRDLEIKDLEQKKIIKTLMITILNNELDAEEVYTNIDHDKIIDLKLKNDIGLTDYDKSFLYKRLDEFNKS